MDKAKTTPGPWRSVELGSEGALITPDTPNKRENIRWIARVTGRDTLTDFANARLMAAAPAMLETLKGILAYIDQSNGLSGYHLNGEIASWDSLEVVDQIREAIAKAEGR